MAVLLGFGLQSCDRDDNNGGDNVDNNGGNNGGGNGGDTVTVQWVDLGLPSGLLWADCNVGAQHPEDYGNYYAWGETAPKEVYDWATYAYGNDPHALTKYCDNANYGLNGFTDYLYILEASDDAATVNLGDSARMPTKMEWQELRDYTTSIWTSKNGVNGLLLTGKNDKSLFLPAAGGCDLSGLVLVGDMGSYWSSSLDATGHPDGAWDCSFSSMSGSLVPTNTSRYTGSCVRAVRASQN